MKRVILDTNVYEFLLTEIERPLLEKALAQKNMIFYGVDTIRKELRGIPRTKRKLVKGQQKNMRVAALELYDLTVGRHHYPLTNHMEGIARKYFLVYHSFGGHASWQEIRNDFLIVSCASLHKLDIVFSEDEATMASEYAQKSYKAANLLLGLRTPRFLRFADLRISLRGGRLD